MEESKKILCVGECVLDIIHICNNFPLEDSDTRSNHGRWQRGGNASNNCTVLANFGALCELLSTFSKKEMFKFIIHDLNQRNIETENCTYYDDCEVPLSTVLLTATTGSRTIIHSNPNLPDVKYDDFKKCRLENYKWIHFQARNPPETKKMMKSIRDWNALNADKNPITISLDLEKLKKENSSLIEFADYVFLGKDYANYLGASDMKSACYKLKEMFAGSYIVICPWGTAGVAALDLEENLYTEKAYPPEKVVDTLGAGDTFCAACLYCLINGKSLPNTLEFASKVAGEKVGNYGYDHIRDKFKL